jgi:hypothetical protein
MAFPLIPLAAITGALKLGQGLFSGMSEKKKAEAQRRAQQEALAAQRGAHDARQANRGARLDATAGAMANIQPTLQTGAPNYQIDPAVLERIKKPIPFAGSMPADPRAGLGSSLVSGLMGTAGGIGQDMILGHLSQPNGIYGGVPEGVVGGVMEDPLERVKAICKAFPESCAGYIGG